MLILFWNRNKLRNFRPEWPGVTKGITQVQHQRLFTLQNPLYYLTSRVFSNVKVFVSKTLYIWLATSIVIFW